MSNRKILLSAIVLVCGAQASLAETVYSGQIGGSSTGTTIPLVNVLNTQNAETEGYGMADILDPNSGQVIQGAVSYTSTAVNFATDTMSISLLVDSMRHFGPDFQEIQGYGNAWAQLQLYVSSTTLYSYSLAMPPFYDDTTTYLKIFDADQNTQLACEFWDPESTSECVSGTFTLEAGLYTLSAYTSTGHAPGSTTDGFLEFSMTEVSQVPLPLSGMLFLSGLSLLPFAGRKKFQSNN